MSEEVTALVDVLITKMERMDSDIDTLKEQNTILKGMVSNPEALLKQAGFVKAVTPATSDVWGDPLSCLLYTSPSPRDRQKSRMPSSA